MEIIVWFLISFPFTWFVQWAIESFLELNKSSRLKAINGIGEKIVYSAIALFSAGVYDLLKNHESDMFLLFISAPVAWIGIKMIKISEVKQDAI